MSAVSSRLAAALVGALALALLPAAPSFAAAPVTINGQVTNGVAPVIGATVSAVSDDGVVIGSATTDSAGEYTIGGLVVGDYAIHFVSNQAGLANEWSSNARSRYFAQSYATVAGGSYTFNADLAPGQSISGHVGDKAGADVEGSVIVFDANGVYDAASIVSIVNTSGGDYVAGSLPAGTYRIAFTTNTAQPFSGYAYDYENGTYYAKIAESSGGYVSQWWSGAYDHTTATTIPLAPGAPQTADFVIEKPYFADTQDPTSLFYPYIEWMAATGISTGYDYWWASDRPYYEPSNYVSRGAMAAFLYRLSGDTFTAPATPTFSDVQPSDTFYLEIEWMAASGISTGTPMSDGTVQYKPGNSVSRQAMAIFLARYAGFDTSQPATEQVFPDVPVTAASASAVQWMSANGIATGTDDGTGTYFFKPAQSVSRQAMAAFLYRIATASA